MPESIIVIGLHAAPGTSTTGIPLSEKLEILKKCFGSCAREAIDIHIMATGNESGVEEIRKVIPGIPLYGAWGEFDRQRGESVIGARALSVAKEQGAAWIIKIAGDCFFPRQGWAARLIEIGKKAGADLVATAHHRPDWITTQVYAVRREFMEKTWPGQDADYARIGIEAQWGERIVKAGLLPKWHMPPSEIMTVDGTSNAVPKEAAITYAHAHCLASSATWKLAPTDDVQPNPDLRISIVLPAHNEDMKDHKGRFLLPGTIESILETSKGFPEPEIIVVDDGSDRPLPFPSPAPKSLRVIRHSESLGVDPARNTGIAAATGDVIGVLDAHMRIETQRQVPCMAGVQKLATLAIQKQAFVVARCAHLDLPTHPGTPALCGGYFIPLKDPKQPLAIGWNNFTPPEGTRRTTAMLGASYFAPRSVWERTHGFVQDCYNWGYSEEGLSLKAAFLDIAIWYYGDATISHWFLPGRSHPDYLLNRAKVLRVTFEDKTFTDFWLPRCQTGWVPAWKDSLNRHAIKCEAARFRCRKVKTDAQVLKEVFQVNA